MLLNVEVREKRPFGEIPAIRDRLKAIQDKLKGRGRAFMRYSGTEPLARITIEGQDEQEIRTLAEELAEIVRKELG